MCNQRSISLVQQEMLISIKDALITERRLATNQRIQNGYTLHTCKEGKRFLVRRK